MLHVYPACFYREDSGYTVIFPDLNFLSTCGENLENAMEMAIDCLAGYLYSEKIEGNSLPAPSHINKIDPVLFAKELEFDYKECFVNLISVDVETYAKQHFSKSVKKTLTIPEWLNKEAMSRKINFSKVLQEALIAKLNS